MEYLVQPGPDGRAIVLLSGPINEDAEISLQQLAAEITEYKSVEFHFAQVKSINSLGVRACVQFVRSQCELREVLYSECTPDVIMQINMIPSFQGRAKIVSFYTNYICESCDITEKVLVNADTLSAGQIPQPARCSQCGEIMETEELEEEYFAFLMRSISH